jgi:hypothetical protein
LRRRRHNTAQGYRFDDDGDMLEAYVAADMNCDGTINAFDVDAFTLALTATPPDYPEYYSVYPTCDRLNADMNGDAVLDAFDVDLFTEYLTGHAGATGLRQVYTWDPENRLIAVGPADDMTLINSTKRAKYAYDYMGRRIEKKVYTWTTPFPPAQRQRLAGDPSADSQARQRCGLCRDVLLRRHLPAEPENSHPG